MQTVSSELETAVGLDQPMPGRATRALADLIDGLGRSWLWTAMAMQDIRIRYRGSVLGPFWLTLSTAIMIAAMSVIYARLFKTNLDAYLPYLAIGLIVWQFLSTLINEGCLTFLAVQTVILQAPMPFSVHAYRLVCRNFIVLAHNFAIIPIILIFFAPTTGWRALWCLPGFLVLAINGVFVSIFFGMLSARFRDVPPIVTSFVQVLFFVTPIFWSPALLGPFEHIIELNPFFAAIDVIRAPLLDVPTALYSWPILIVTTVVGGAISFAAFARFRSRIAYWI